MYRGQDVPDKYRKLLREKGVLQEGEQLIYFYTDAFSDILDGCYFVTDRHLVVYMQEWNPPEEIMPYDELSYLNIEYSDEALLDSYIRV
ncbi:MAG: hypothetical protein AAFO94_11825, partial [Bacteroidota bacterium]